MKIWQTTAWITRITPMDRQELKREILDILTPSIVGIITNNQCSFCLPRSKNELIEEIKPIADTVMGKVDQRTPSLDDVLGEVLNTIAKTMISQGNYEYVSIEDIIHIINEIKERYGDHF